MENQIFSPSRFLSLSVRFIYMNRRQLLLSAMSVPVAMTLVSGLLGLLWQNFEPAMIVSVEELWFYLVSALAGCYVASWMFRDDCSRGSAIQTLTLPVSVFESFLVRWLVAVPLFCLWAMDSAAVADGFRLAVNMLSGAPDDLILSLLSGLRGADGSQMTSDIMSVPLFLMLQSFFLLGSVVWRGNNFLKTIGALWIIAIVYFLAGQGVVGAMYILGGYEWTAGDIFVSPVALTAMTLVALFNYFITWLRLRETDLADKW